VRRFGAVGLSNVTFEEYRAGRAITEVACVQNAYNLADRSDQALLDACAADGIAYVPFFPLGSAFHPDKSVLTAPAVVATPTARRHNRPGGTGLAPAALSEPAADPWNVLAYPPSRESRGS
jgi:aryl-alcohol dehydrogenase-like predicted oxidoreductase